LTRRALVCCWFGPKWPMSFGSYNVCLTPLLGREAAFDWDRLTVERPVWTKTEDETALLVDRRTVSGEIEDVAFDVSGFSDPLCIRLDHPCIGRHHRCITHVAASL
jgi:hypothetical protein